MNTDYDPRNLIAKAEEIMHAKSYIDTTPHDRIVDNLLTLAIAKMQLERKSSV